MSALLALLLAADPRPYDPSSVASMDALAIRLRRHVAEVEVVLPAEPPLSAEERSGYAAILGPSTLACLGPLVNGAARVEVRGPGGALHATVRLVDLERRVAILESEAPLARVGLEVPEAAPLSSLALDAPIFAMVATSKEAHVMNGVILDAGEAPELEGHPRISLRLEQGMPVFDDRARLLGYARTGALDKDRALIVTLAHVREARTASASATPRASASSRPWWAK